MPNPEIDYRRQVVYLPEGWRAEELTARGRPINAAEERLEPEFSIVREWAERERPRSVDTLIVWRGAFVPRGEHPDDLDRSSAMRIANCLELLGYRNSGRRNTGRTLYVSGDE